jgi:hypothetical protein
MTDVGDLVLLSDGRVGVAVYRIDDFEATALPGDKLYEELIHRSDFIIPGKIGLNLLTSFEKTVRSEWSGKAPHAEIGLVLKSLTASGEEQNMFQDWLRALDKLQVRLPEWKELVRLLDLFTGQAGLDGNMSMAMYYLLFRKPFPH